MFTVTEIYHNPFNLIVDDKVLYANALASYGLN